MERDRELTMAKELKKAILSMQAAAEAFKEVQKANFQASVHLEKLAETLMSRGVRETDE